MGVINSLNKLKHDSNQPYTAIFDGSIGCYYTQITQSHIVFSEYANISDSETIIKIHKDYINAGAHAIRTNTLMANRFSLCRSQTVVSGLLSRGYKNAEKAVKESKKLIDIFACIGQLPLDASINSLDEYKYLIDVFEKCGAYAYSFEGFTETKHLFEISKYIKNKNKKNFIMVHFEVNPEGYSNTGISGLELARVTEEINTIDMFGFSCSTGPQHLFKFINAVGHFKKSLCCMSNAGLPNDSNSYFCTPKYFADKMSTLTSLGIKVIGGLKGATPMHILELSSLIYSKAPVCVEKKMIPDKNEWLDFSKNKPINKINQTTKTIIVELFQTTDYEEISSNTKKLKEAGANIISFSDSFHGKTGIDSSILSAKIKRELKAETMPHLISKNRDRNSLRSTVLGLHMEKIRNIFAVSGETISTEGPKRSNNTSFSSIEMLEYINQMNKTTLFNDPIICSAAFNPNVSNIDSEIDKAKRKIDAGVEYFITQPVFCGWAFENIIKAKKILKEAKIIGGILPVTSYESALYLRNEIPSISIPNDFLETYRNLSTEESNRLAVKNSIDFAKTLRHFCEGYFIFSSPKKVDLICKIIEHIKRNLLVLFLFYFCSIFEQFFLPNKILFESFLVL